MKLVLALPSLLLAGLVNCSRPIQSITYAEIIQNTEVVDDADAVEGVFVPSAPSALTAVLDESSAPLTLPPLSAFLNLIDWQSVRARMQKPFFFLSNIELDTETFRSARNFIDLGMYFESKDLNLSNRLICKAW